MSKSPATTPMPIETTSKAAGRAFAAVLHADDEHVSYALRYLQPEQLREVEQYAETLARIALERRCQIEPIRMPSLAHYSESPEFLAMKKRYDLSTGEVS